MSYDKNFTAKHFLLKKLHRWIYFQVHRFPILRDTKKCNLTPFRVSYDQNFTAKHFFLKKLHRWIYFQVHRFPILRDKKKCYLTPLRVSYDKIIFTKKILRKSCTKCWKIGFEEHGVFSEPTFQIFTGQFPVSPDIRWKIKKFWSFIYPLAVGHRNPFVIISFRSQMAPEKLVGGPKKKVTLMYLRIFDATYHI